MRFSPDELDFFLWGSVNVCIRGVQSLLSRVPNNRALGKPFHILYGRFRREGDSSTVIF